jgi:hypothetical protein
MPNPKKIRRPKVSSKKPTGKKANKSAMAALGRPKTVKARIESKQRPGETIKQTAKRMMASKGLSPTEMRQLRKIAKIVKRSGGRVSARCAR